MQVFGHGRRFARAASAAIRSEAAEGGEVAAYRRDILDRWHLARREGVSAGKAAEVVGIPRSTLFNWDRLRRQGRLEPRSRRPWRLRRTAWSAELVKAVIEARREQPMWGKAKIAVVVRSELPEGKAASESTVGRILTHLMRQGTVKPVPALRRKAPRAARSQRAWAQRRPTGLKPKKPGEIVQVDTLTVTPKGGRPPVKQFVAADPVSKWTCAKAYRRATARNAKDFLDKLIREMPFAVEAVQVDGGSEFKAEFERECQERTIPLWVLPPRSPKLNGHVERTIGTWRYEFYGCWDIPDDLVKVNRLVDAFADEFNRVRPHRSLGCLAPEEALNAQGRPPDDDHPP